MTDILSNESIMHYEKLPQPLKGVFLAQIDRFNTLSKANIKNGLTFDEQGKVILVEGTLIHGTRRDPDLNKLESISQVGILTGQAIGQEEDGETYFCADFFRVAQSMSLEKYGEQFKDPMRFTPFDGGSNSIAFIVTPSAEINELIRYDCYRSDTEESKLTKSFVNLCAIAKRDASSLASILYGVPSNAITGIIIGDNLFENPNLIDFFVKSFPNCYIFSKKGEIIYNPLQENIDKTEYAKTKGLEYYNLCEVERLKTECQELTDRFQLQINKYSILMNSIISICTPEQAAKILAENGYQGGFDYLVEYVKNLKKRKSESLAEEPSANEDTTMAKQ